MEFNEYLYFFWQTMRMHLQKNIRVPLSIYIHITNRCNNKCEYCRVYQMPQTDSLTTEALKSAISEMHAMGTRRIHLTGGEPMLREDLGEIIYYAKKLGLFVGLSTNGYQIPERIKELIGVDAVFLSYDGPNQVHKRLRGGQDVSTIKEAIGALKKAGIRVWTTTVLTKWNEDCLEDIIGFAKENHILANFNRLEFFTDSPHKLHPPLVEIEDLVLRGAERKKVFQKLIDLKISRAPIASSLEYLKIDLEWPYDDKITDTKISKQYKCWAGKAYGHIDSDGKLYSCGWGALREIGGVNIMDEGFQSAWNKLICLESCNSCSHACGVENNLMFSLNPSWLINAAVQMYK